ncbi:MAG: hypothetical protein GY931_08005 [Maribacter sp.]|nr:hypothetical protein [Maribacter sp.]
MKISVFIVSLFILCLACKTDSEVNSENQKNNQDIELVFDKYKWKTKDGKDYPYRNQMINDVVYNDTIRTLNKEQLLELLGEPDYIREGHLYYRINETRLGSWTIKTKSMVIKLVDDGSIEWIKIHE